MPMQPPRRCTGCQQLVTGSCPSCARVRQQHAHDYRASWDKGCDYTGRPWRRARATFLAAYPFCKGCGRLATQVHHDPPHLGRIEAFFDASRFVGVCRECHQQETTREVRERRAGTFSVREATDRQPTGQFSTRINPRD